jgi:uncharacterized protein YndB with AHSA1/START domain
MKKENPMPADELFTLDGRPSVRVEREYPHAIEKVWRAVTTPEHLGQWFPSPVEIDLRPGGKIHFGAFEGGPGATGTVEVVDAPRRLTFTWDTDRMTFELAANGDSTTFVLIHSFDDRYGAPSFATGWDVCLAGLRSVLAGEPLPPPDRGIARHEELVHEFGLDQPEVTESGGGWTVRVERQLVCPAEIAWDLWFGKDRETGEQRAAPAVGEPLTPYMAPDVVIGTMTEVEPHRVFAFEVAPTGGPGDHLRVELDEGTGHGARIVLTVTGTDPSARDAAVEMWGAGAVGHLAASAADWAMEQPVDA